MPKFAPAEIERVDLATFTLDLAQWGTNEHDLALLTQPNAATFEEARAVLKMLGALDETGRITDHGRALSRVPFYALGTRPGGSRQGEGDLSPEP